MKQPECCPECGSCERDQRFYASWSKTAAGETWYYDSRKRIRKNLDMGCSNRWHDLSVKPERVRFLEL